MTRNYRLIDHTADFGLEIWGDDETALFEEAAKALFDLIFDPAAVKAQHCRTVEVQGDDWPDLMVNWLRELLYMFNGQERIVGNVAVTGIDKGRVQAAVAWEAFDPRRHEIKAEIKAVTYHQIDVGPCEGGWRARVIFDI
ncbi:MAG: archease [Desulfobacteraceae bacterium]